MKIFGYECEEKRTLDEGTSLERDRYIISFKNGYAASVIFFKAGTAYIRHREPCYEIAVRYNGDIVYDTPVTGDVVQVNDEEGVAEVLRKIEALPPRQPA